MPSCRDFLGLSVKRIETLAVLQRKVHFSSGTNQHCVIFD